MAFKKFRLLILLRIFTLIVAILLFAFLWVKAYPTVLTVGTGLLVLVQTYNLVHFTEKIQHHLIRFFQSIQYDDFTQSFPVRASDPFSEIVKSFNQVNQQFLRLRSEKEEHFQYLQTVVQHVAVGLISFKSNGDVQLINNTAKQLLQINELRNIQTLKSSHPGLVEKLVELQPGSCFLFKTGSANQPSNLSVRATRFKLRGENYLLVSLQNIQSEIERERLAKELEIASQIQKSLLPKANPVLPGFDIAGICIPAEEVGGDYYDFISLGEDKIAIVIGDVSGKGIPAAFYMTLTKGFIQSHLTGTVSPRHILCRVNELLVNCLAPQSFVTLFLSILDLQKKEVVSSRAGHNPAFLFSAAADSFTTIKPAGPALGLKKSLRPEELEEVHVKLQAGDWLILYTDGISEAMNMNFMEFGMQKLANLIRGHHQKNANEMVAEVLSEVKHFQADIPPTDDLTLIAVKVRPDDETAKF